jgi:hypothetical protein
MCGSRCLPLPPAQPHNVPAPFPFALSVSSLPRSSPNLCLRMSPSVLTSSLLLAASQDTRDLKPTLHRLAVVGALPAVSSQGEQRRPATREELHRGAAASSPGVKQRARLAPPRGDRGRVTLEGAVTAVRSPGRAPQPQRPDLGFFIFRTFFFKFLFFFFWIF